MTEVMTEVIKNSINLYEGDCLEKLKLIKDGSIDMILTDPPYGTTACKWDSIIDLDLMWKELKRVIKPNGAIVLFCAQPFTSLLIASNVKQFKHIWVWNKKVASNSQLAKYQPLRIHEDIAIFSKKSAIYNPQGLKDCNIIRSNKNREKGVGHINVKTETFKQTKTNYPKTIIDFKPHNLGKLHPTQKPVALLEYLIKTYTNENETVLDFTIGSGSTCIAAMNTKRNCIGIELDNNYFNVSSKRVEDHNETLETKYTITKHEKE